MKTKTLEACEVVQGRTMHTLEHEGGGEVVMIQCVVLSPAVLSLESRNRYWKSPTQQQGAGYKTTRPDKRSEALSVMIYFKILIVCSDSIPTKIVLYGYDRGVHFTNMFR